MLSAWFNDPELKKAVIQRLREHKRLDEIVQKIYWRHGKGCCLGCLTHMDDSIGSPHEATERLFGIPIRIAHLLESVFEGLSIKHAKEWVVESINAIMVGADLSLVHHHLVIWLLSSETGINTITDENSDAIMRVRSLHIRASRLEPVADSEWSAASLAERSAASSASRSAAWKRIADKLIELLKNAPLVECESFPDLMSDSFTHIIQTKRISEPVGSD